MQRFAAREIDACEGRVVVVIPEDVGLQQLVEERPHKEGAKARVGHDGNPLVGSGLGPLL